MKFRNALKWSFAAELASKFVQPIVFIALAQLLPPEDFGVVSAATMVIAFSQVFWDAGMNKALIQRQSDIDQASNAVFYINIVVGIIVASAVYVSAPMIAYHLFSDQDITIVLRVMTLQILLGSLASVHTALLQKRMSFKKLFWVRLATVSVPGLVSIPLAWSGMGIWALILGTLLGQLLQVIILWNTSNWKPVLEFDVTIANEMWNFGRWVLVTGLLGWVYQWADSLVVGAYMGSKELGIYRTGNQLIVFFYAGITGPIVNVLYSWMSKKNASEIQQALEDVVSVLALFFIPFSFFVYLSGNLFSEILFDAEWQGIGTVISVMSVSHGLSFLLIANAEAYRAIGKPQLETIAMVLGLFIFLPTYIITASMGLEFFVYSRLAIVTLFGFVLHAWVAKVYLKINVFFFLKFLCVFIVVFSVSFFLKYFEDDMSEGYSSFIVFTGVFIALFILGRRTYFRLLYRALEKV